MNDPFSKKLEDIRQEAEDSGMRVFYGYLAEERSVPSVHWNSENGGDWKKFFACARTVSANILYLNWAPFEQFEIDDSIAELESRTAEVDEEDNETKKLVSQIKSFQSKVGMICVIDLAFVANGVVHIYQETADWFDEFGNLVADDEDGDGDKTAKARPVSKAVLDRWATALASHPTYPTIKQHEYLFEKIAGEEFPKLPVYDILRRAEAIFQVDFKQQADEKLAGEIKGLRDQGLNIHAIAMKLGIPKERVSGLVSLMTPRKK